MLSFSFNSKRLPFFKDEHWNGITVNQQFESIKQIIILVYKYPSYVKYSELID